MTREAHVNMASQVIIIQVMRPNNGTWLDVNNMGIHVKEIKQVREDELQGSRLGNVLLSQWHGMTLPIPATIRLGISTHNR